MILRPLSAERAAVAQRNSTGAVAMYTLLPRRCYKGKRLVTSSSAVPNHGRVAGNPKQITIDCSIWIDIRSHQTFSAPPLMPRHTRLLVTTCLKLTGYFASNIPVFGIIVSALVQCVPDVPTSAFLESSSLCHLQV